MLIEAPNTADAPTLSYGRAAIVFDVLRRTLEASPQFCTVRVIRVTDDMEGLLSEDAPRAKNRLLARNLANLPGYPGRPGRVAQSGRPTAVHHPRK